MGDVQQLELIKKLSSRMSGPILEIGSKRYGEPPISFDYRTLFPSSLKYVGVDAAPGTGVDVVADMTSNIDVLRTQLGQERFNTIICLSVIEHVPDIFAFARNVEELLDEGGMAVISAPFTWELHGYPGDYWRFTMEGIRYLFSSIDFDLQLSQLHIDGGDTVSLDEAGNDPNRWTMYFSAAERSNRSTLGRVKRVGFSLLRRAVGLKKNMFYSSMYDMVGFKKR